MSLRQNYGYLIKKDVYYDANTDAGGTPSLFTVTFPKGLYPWSIGNTVVTLFNIKAVSFQIALCFKAENGQISWLLVIV